MKQDTGTKMSRSYKILAVIIMLLAAIGLSFLVDSAIQLIKDDNHEVAQCESLGGSWDGGCWYAGKLVDVNALMEDLYGSKK